MNILQNARYRVLLIGMALLSNGLVGCAVQGDYAYGPHGPASSLNIGLDYYEPFGFDYGGWGPGYYLGPPLVSPGRGRFPRDGPAPNNRPPNERPPRDGPTHDGDARNHLWRPAPPGHAMPSIPAGPRAPRVGSPARDKH